MVSYPDPKVRNINARYNAVCAVLYGGPVGRALKR